MGVGSTADLSAPETSAEALGSAVPPERLAAAIDHARDHLRSLQSDEGWWKAELQTNVTMDAEDLLLREFLGIRDQQVIERAATWIRSQQRSDGTWTNFHG